MNHTEKRFLIAEMAIKYLKSKEREPQYNKCSKFSTKPYYTYLVEAAVFDDDFHQPPTIKQLQVRLSDDDYLQLLQWQLHNPTSGYNAYSEDIADIIGEVEFQIEEELWDNENVGTYAVNLTEIRNDAKILLKHIEEREK